MASCWITVVFLVNIWIPLTCCVFSNISPASLPLHMKYLGVGVVVIWAPTVPMNSQRDWRRNWCKALTYRPLQRAHLRNAIETTRLEDFERSFRRKKSLNDQSRRLIIQIYQTTTLESSAHFIVPPFFYGTVVGWQVKRQYSRCRQRHSIFISNPYLRRYRR